MKTLRAGMVGAGPVTQAIHLPTIARLGGRVRVDVVMDPDSDLAEAVAAPLEARAVTSLDALVQVPLDIAVIGSPNAFHVGQLEALCSAGVRAVLMEKPLAVTRQECAQVLTAIRASGTILVVGAMHSYDPAWLAALEALNELRLDGPFHIRSSIYIPNNPRFEDMASLITRPEPRPGTSQSPADMLRGAVLGLTIHNLPHIRHFVPSLETVIYAKPVSPYGYSMTATGCGSTIELLARCGGTWQPDWTLTVMGADFTLDLSFPPSYVHGGSARSRVTTADGSVRCWGPFAANGYEAEWRELIALLDGEKPPRYSLETLLDDIGYAITLADLAAAAQEERS
ncbi:MAG: Gfo/Idh/MocA family oxidoreductase [Propionibacteriaceae bacterium]|jgi:predicted dehydrogenase|nr:Gfo/Idh/MocA family oxidoreductase [Propionibacteriaceae bacterium]